MRFLLKRTEWNGNVLLGLLLNGARWLCCKKLKITIRKENFKKEIQRILKAATSDARIAWLRVGDYKSKPNTVGGMQTITPTQVCDELQKLLC